MPLINVKPIKGVFTPGQDQRTGSVGSATATSRQEPISANDKHLPRSGTVRTNGQELFYEIHGDGPPLVLVMGIGYDSSLWTLQQVPVLSARFRVVLLDNRDAGPPEPITPTPSPTWPTMWPACSMRSISTAPTCWACRWEA